ncbi:hypothetical protein HMPREF1252_1783 [Peptoniphilus sp. BV3AC2]|nr:hypothetical protein HMPREF1252_1783 [Peptoniphilus sp. BV3AC2]
MVSFVSFVFTTGCAIISLLISFLCEQYVFYKTCSIYYALVFQYLFFCSYKLHSFFVYIQCIQEQYGQPLKHLLKWFIKRLNLLLSL